MESELIFIFFLALILLGPRKLPELSRKLGKMMAEFRRAKSEFTAQIENEVRRLEEEGNKLLPAETGNVIQPPTAAPAGTVTTAGQVTEEPSQVKTESAVNGSGISQESHA